MISVTRKVLFARRSDRTRALLVVPEDHRAVPAGRVPRVSRLMALAIHFDRLIREGKVTDQSDLARLAHVSQPRMTQIMNLNHLAPDIQEALLCLPPVTCGRERIGERHLRPLAAEYAWAKQRGMWRHLQVAIRGGAIKG